MCKLFFLFVTLCRREGGRGGDKGVGDGVKGQGTEKRGRGTGEEGG